MHESQNYRKNVSSCITNSPTLCTPFRRQQDEHWIRKLGTAFPYGCNDNIGSIGNISSPKCASSNVNVMGIFNNTSRRKRSHGHRLYNKPIIHDVSFDSLLTLPEYAMGSTSHSHKTLLCPFENFVRFR
jgi:hypothetical protein